MGVKPNQGMIDGFRVPPSFVEDVLISAMRFKPAKDDIVVATYPKCGTTWAQQIITLILKKGVPPSSAEEYWACNPFLETVGAEGIQSMTRPGVIKTHLPFDRITFSKEAKYVYVTRHPADCAVSYFHHVRYFPIYFFSDGKFDDFFDVFVEGEVDYGDYFDHLFSWYEHRNEPNLFIITFEEMKADHRGSVLRIAKFLGEEYHASLVANNDAILDKVLEHSSVEYMKSSVGSFWNETLQPPPPNAEIVSPVWQKYSQLIKEAAEKGHHSVGDFVRKGQVGEGKVVLSKDQMDRLNARIADRTAQSDVMQLWKKT